MDMRNDNADSDFYDLKIKILWSMLKRAVALEFLMRGAIPKKDEDGYWYAIGYHLIGGNKYLTDRQHDALRVFRDFKVPPTADEVMEIRRGVSDRVSEDQR